MLFANGIVVGRLLSVKVAHERAAKAHGIKGNQFTRLSKIRGFGFHTGNSNFVLRLNFSIIMGAQAGPSNLHKAKNAKVKDKRPVNAGKAKKLTEKQRIIELEKAATEFVSCNSIAGPLS